jgi:hypothetical protein
MRETAVCMIDIWLDKKVLRRGAERRLVALFLQAA